MKDGVTLIEEERVRQMAEEGWTPEHDDCHDLGELARAGIAYAWHTQWPCGVDEFPVMWPFTGVDFKPAASEVRNLVKAGALIAAEIDRLQRRLEKKKTAGAA